MTPDPADVATAWSENMTSADSEPSAATPLPSDSAPGSQVEDLGKGGVQALRQVTGLVLGQLSAVTALAFYFGWARTNAFLQYFGLDASVVNLSTTDYVLRSVGAAYWPLMWIGLLVLVALTVHSLIRSALATMSAIRRRSWLLAMVLLGAAMLTVAFAGLFQVWIFPPSVPVIPLLITSGVALITYTAVLYSRADIGRRGILQRAQFVALAGLIAGGVFWTWGSYAAEGGTSSAEGTAAHLAYHADVSVFSSQRLGLAGPGIKVDAIGDDQTVYRFRYTGLRLLLRSDNRYFLLPMGWRRGQDPVIVLSESHDVRLQFVAPPYP